MSRWYLFALAGLAAISPAPLSARTMYLSAGGDDNSQPGPGATFRTVGRAFEALAAGDTLIVREGSHLGGQIVTVSGTAAAPIVIRGESLSAAIDSAARDNRDALRLEGCSYIVIENLTFRKGGRGGLAIYGSDHVTVRGCRMGDNGIWGIITSFADDLHLEDNECWGSKIEHGIYHANSGDRFVIRGNRSHHNSGCGIHMNGDPEIGGGDGVLNFGIVENNIIYENGGGKGGAGLNMTHVQDIIVRHNLLYRNHAGGITFYQDADASAQGSKRGLFLGNTIVFHWGRPQRDQHRAHQRESRRDGQHPGHQRQQCPAAGIQRASFHHPQRLQPLLGLDRGTFRRAGPGTSAEPGRLAHRHRQ